jgi:hydrogenase expression/formation protein HypD
MKYIEEFRDSDIARGLTRQITALADRERQYRFMEFCGGHTHAIHRYGIPSLLPDNVELIHGPGCPVCVLPIARIDQAIYLAQQPDTILCSYADMLRVPGSRQDSLLKAKARGADVRMVYSVTDALQIARDNVNKRVVFFAIGFETTTPPTAVAVQTAQRERLQNFFVFCNHVLTPVAMAALLHDSDTPLDGFIGPAHVSIVIGSQAYAQVAERYRKPIVIAGFEPLDIMQSMIMLLEQVNRQRCEVENQYTRAVQEGGNLMAQQIMRQVFCVRDRFEWRGLGMIAHSALQLRDAYAAFDAERQFPVTISVGKEHKACACADVLRGVKKPQDCKVFGIVCTPQNPLGSCMVSAEGACAAHYAYGRLSQTPCDAI